MIKYILSLLCVLSLTVPSPAQCIKGNCQNGVGTFVYESGARFEGEFRNGRPHGRGKLIYANRDVYQGQFINGRREGIGEMVFISGNRYNGSFKAGQIEGSGTFTFANGDVYQGEVAQDKPNGSGSLTFKTGAVYVGRVQDGVPHGLGTMTYTDGSSYTGSWQRGKRHGSGTFTESTGVQRSGQWHNDELTHYLPQSANATVSTPGADTSGKLRDCNKNFCKSGKGFYVYMDGSRWEGEFKDGYPHGQGVIWYADKSRYEGAFANHAPHGEGVMYYSSGRVFGAVWENGVPVKQKYTGEAIDLGRITPELNPLIKVWAVIVGVGRYTAMPVLKYTDDDAYRLYAFLKSPEGGSLPDRQIKVLIDDDATRGNILRAVTDVLGKADANDVILFYFSGHGLDGSFLPVDFDGMNNRLTHQELRQALDRIHARHKIVIADACHSGSLFASRDVASSQATSQRLYNAFENSSGGMALLMSSKSEEYSLEDQGLRSGVFSYFLIRGLRGAADTNGNKVIDITELYNYTSREVRQYTQNLQTPVISGKFDPRMPVGVVR